MINVHKDLLREISIHAPHEGERRVACNAGGYFVDISIHAPHEGERPVIHKLLLFKRRISIHAPHEGERHTLTLGELRIIARFQSTLPTRGSDELGARTPREGERPVATSPAGAHDAISIHAPHEGERPPAELAGLVDKWISIHAPHEGERPATVGTVVYFTAFQSTLPTRGSDGYTIQETTSDPHFNPRSPRGGATWWE